MYLLYLNISHELCVLQSIILKLIIRLPRWLSGKEFACKCRRSRFGPWVGKIPWRRKWQPTPVFLTGESHAQRDLAGYSPWQCKESGTTEATWYSTGGKVKPLIRAVPLQLVLNTDSGRSAFGKRYKGELISDCFHFLTVV